MYVVSLFVTLQLGVRLEDRTGDTRWKLDSPDVLLKEIEAKRTAERAKKLAHRNACIRKLQAEIQQVC